MLPISRIYTFIHHSKRFSFHLIDGQKIIADLAVLHNFSPKSLTYLRDTLLSSLLFERLIKPGETLGFYIDSQKPFFKFKLELSHSGQFRTMILPQDLKEIPQKFNGMARLTKNLPGASPYTSIVKAENDKTSHVFNTLLKQSYQDESISYISQVSDHSLLISKLPKDSQELESSTPSVESFFKDNLHIFQDFFNKQINTEEALIHYFENQNFTYLAGKDLEFKCPCSREHYLIQLQHLNKETKEEICQDQQIDLTCDYCLSPYTYSREEIL